MNLARKVTLNASALVAARALTVVSGIATVTLGSRYLPLGEYGSLIAAIALVGIVEIATDLGISTMAAREIARHPERERQIVGDVFGLSLTLGLVAAAVGWGVVQLVYAGADDEDIRRATSILLLNLIAVGPIGAARAHFVANQRAYLSAAAEAVGMVVAVVGTVVAVTADLGLVGVAAAQPASRLSQAAASSLFMRGSLTPSISLGPARWRALFMIALPLGGVMVINFLYIRLDAVLLSLMRSADDVALYGLAYKVVEALIVLPSYFMVTLLPEIARMDPQSQRLHNVMGQAVAVMEMIALPVGIVIAAFAEEIVTSVGGERFRPAAPALQILAVGLALSFVVGVYGHALVALGKQARLLWQSLGVLALNLIMNLFTIPAFGIEGAAAAVAVSELTALLVARRLYAQVAKPPRNPLRGRMLLAGSLMLAVFLGARRLGWDGTVGLFLAGLCGALLYAVSLRALHAVPEVVETQLLPMLRRRRSGETV